MPKKRRRTLVIDASVARSAGKTENPRSQKCRRFLRWVLKYCHRLVLSNDLQQEWTKHESSFTRHWRVAMEQKGKVVKLGRLDSGTLQNRIDALKIQKAPKRAMKKDALLVVAAQAADRTVVSLDNEARDLFQKHANQLKTPRGIIWRNPEKDAIPWK